MSFGGISVLICGDFHQFPPVATSPTEALYYPTNPVKDSVNSQIGQTIYEEFTMVVILKKQLRVTDELWKEFLGRLRCGRVLREDIRMLHGLVLGGGPKAKANFDEEPWINAHLVTPRHAVCNQWNSAAA